MPHIFNNAVHSGTVDVRRAQAGKNGNGLDEINLERGCRRFVASKIGLLSKNVHAMVILHDAVFL
jgi:hypothetical protein